MTRFELARESDDAALRALLRDNRMPGWIAMTFEREPSFFAGLNRFGTDRAVIGRENGLPVAMYLCSEHPVHVNGLATHAGYLAGLRVERAFRNRPRILREGYASIRTLCAPDDRPYWYTTIAAENAPARRVLEARLRGLPHYEPVGELVTMALPRARGRMRGLWRPAAAEELDALCELHNRHASRFHFSPVLTPARARQTGARFFVHGRNGHIAACMALWDQRQHKQAVARGYRAPLAALRPLYNAFAKMSRRVCLPAVDEPIHQTFLAFFAVEDPSPEALVELLRDALALCNTRILTLGLHAGAPGLARLARTFRPAEYRTRVYAVSFEKRPTLDARACQPEVALL